MKPKMAGASFLYVPIFITIHSNEWLQFSLALPWKSKHSVTTIDNNNKIDFVKCKGICITDAVHMTDGPYRERKKELKMNYSLKVFIRLSYYYDITGRTTPQIESNTIYETAWIINEFVLS